MEKRVIFNRNSLFGLIFIALVLNIAPIKAINDKVQLLEVEMLQHKNAHLETFIEALMVPSNYSTRLFVSAVYIITKCMRYSLLYAYFSWKEHSLEGKNAYALLSKRLARNVPYNLDLLSAYKTSAPTDSLKNAITELRNYQELLAIFHTAISNGSLLSTSIVLFFIIIEGFAEKPDSETELLLTNASNVEILILTNITQDSVDPCKSFIEEHEILKSRAWIVAAIIKQQKLGDISLKVELKVLQALILGKLDKNFVQNLDPNGKLIWNWYQQLLSQQSMEQKNFGIFVTPENQNKLTPI